MPYKVFKKDGDYCVHKHDATGKATGDALGCHKTRKGAMSQLRALYDSEKDKAEKQLGLYDQETVEYTPISPKQGEACAGCRWFQTYGNEYSQQDRCHIVQDWPDAIEPTGWCKRFERSEREEYKPDPLPVVIVEDDSKEQTPPVDEDSGVFVAEKANEDEQPITRKGVREMIGDVLALVFGKEEPDPQIGGFKAYGNRWIGWWTNNFRDREGEFFSEKAIDDYVARVDMGLVPYPDLWHWHVPGTKHGKADWLGRIGHLVVASGTFDDTPLGRAAQASYAKGERYSMSHGFTYDKRFKRDSVYHQFNTFELTTLPRPVAANAFTDFEGVKSMTLTPEKREALEKLFGKDKAAELIAETEAKSKALEELGVEFKDFGHVDGAGEAAKEAVANAETDLKALFPDLMEGSSLAVQASLEAVKQVKAANARADELEKRMKALEDNYKDRPRSASRDEGTELTPERLKELLENAEKQQKTIDKFWGTEVPAT